MSSEEIEHNQNDTEKFQDETTRVSTDENYFTLHFVFLCGLGSLLTYCVFNGDIQRLIRGYDNNKNVCGIRNFLPDKKKVTDFDGLDLHVRPYLLVFKPDGRNTYNVTYTGTRSLDIAVVQSLSSDVARVCIGNCNMYPHYETFKSRCILKKRKGVSDRFFGKSGIPNLFVEVAEDLALCWKKILFVELGCSVLSFLVIILLKLLTWAMIWFILVTVVVFSLAFTTYMWVLFAETKQNMDESESLPAELDLERNRTYLAFAIIGTFIVVPVLIYIIMINRKRMEIVIRMYKEIVKSLNDMPLLFLFPILTCMFMALAIGVWIYATLWIESSGNVEMLRINYFEFVKDPWNSGARWYNLIGLIWIILFLLDCQHMIISGAVSFRYFCRDKNNLGVPIFFAFYNLLRYHLGSVSLGSLITLLVAIPRRSFVLMQRFFKGQDAYFTTKCCLCFLNWRENVLKYFSRDSYIEVALYGCPFLVGGRQAFKTLTANDFGIFTVKEIGNFVLHFANILTCTIAVLAGAIILQEDEDLLHIWVILFLIGIFACAISTCFLALYQSTIDTIFLCFCEDYEQCNGLSEPYFMSEELLKIIMDSQKLVGELD